MGVSIKYEDVVAEPLRNGPSDSWVPTWRAPRLSAGLLPSRRRAQQVGRGFRILNTGTMGASQYIPAVVPGQKTALGADCPHC